MQLGYLQLFFTSESDLIYSQAWISYIFLFLVIYITFYLKLKVQSFYFCIHYVIYYCLMTNKRVYGQSFMIITSSSGCGVTILMNYVEHCMKGIFGLSERSHEPR